MEQPALILLIVMASMSIGYGLGALIATVKHRDIERAIWREAEKQFRKRLEYIQRDAMPCDPCNHTDPLAGDMNR